MRGAWGRNLLAVTAAAVAVAVPACAADTAVALANPSSSVVAAVSADTPIAAGGGWLVWSVPGPGGWTLEALHGGTLIRLPAARRPQPFDVSVGTDASGHWVAVFSRCSRTPRYRGVGGGEVAPGGGGLLLVPSSGSGCRIHMIELAGGAERALPIPALGVSSDTTPSIWHGEVTFGRRSRRHGSISQVVTWSPRHRHQIVLLPHGAVPVCAGTVRSCDQPPLSAEVAALARDGSLIAFDWEVSGGSVGIEGAWETRAVSVKGFRDAVIAGGAGHEACTSTLPPGHLEYIWPEAPLVSGSEALQPELEGFSCFESFASRLGYLRLGQRKTGFGRLPQAILTAAIDGRTLYALVPGPAPKGADAPSCSAAEPCSIERLALPPVTTREAPYRPFG
jgi:hypothetical protein